MSQCDLVKQSHGLTDDQKVMEQCGCGGYSADYQEILSSDSHVYSSLTESATSDDYETIEEMVREAELEWRVLSRLEGEMGEDWRIVNSMPRPARVQARQSRLYEMCETVTGSEKFKGKEKIKEPGQQVEGVEAGLVSISCRPEMAGCEQTINAPQSFRGNFTFWSKTAEDFYESNSPGVSSQPDRLPAAYLRKQVTFGKLLVFPC